MAASILGGNLSLEVSIGGISYSSGDNPKAIDNSVALADAVANDDLLEVFIFRKLSEGNHT